MSPYRFIQLDRQHEGRLAVVTLDHPPVNVLDLALMEELGAALGDGTEADVLLLRGAGKHFSAGVDVADHTTDRIESMLEAFHGLFHRLDELAAVSVAEVHGAAFGGGLELALGCDLMVGTVDCRLAFPEIKLGVFPPFAAARFPLRYSDRVITELILSGEEISGERAAALGLVNRLAKPEAIETATSNLIATLLAHSGAALRHARRALMIGRSGATKALDDVERLYLRELMQTHDATEGLAAFLGKRKPVWRHR